MRQRLYDIIFEADTRAGKAFDVGLLLLILASIVVVMIDSIEPVRAQYGRELKIVEWCFTIVFTAEYLLRLYCVRRPLRYAFSFFGIVDLLAILPTYLSLFFVGAESLLVVRSLRMLRVFRVFKLVRFLGEAAVLARAVRSSIPKLTVFLTTVLSVVVIVGAAMYLIEGDVNEDITNIPEGVYWAIVTVTTVGYGDIVPQTDVGRALSALLMLIGFAILAVPTGIMAAEIMISAKKGATTQVCPDCLVEGHDHDARYCKGCGAELNPDETITS